MGATVPTLKRPCSERRRGMDRLRSMEIFVRVAEAKSFAGAAAQLSIPRSTVTRAIKDLERHLGVALIQRTTRRFSLTEDGDVYFSRVSNLVEEIRAIEGGIPGASNTTRGTVRLNTTPSIARHLLVPLLPAFHRAHPDISINISTSDRIVDTIGAGLDCVIRAGEPEDSTSISARKLGSFEWVLCGSPAYLKEFGEPVDLNGLTTHRFVGYVGMKRDLYRFRCGEDEVTVAPESWLTIDDTETYIEAGLQGLGLVRAARFLVARHLETKSLRVVLHNADAAHTSVHFIHSRTIFPTPAVRSFRDWLRNRLIGKARLDG